MLTRTTVAVPMPVYPLKRHPNYGFPQGKVVDSSLARLFGSQAVTNTAIYSRAYAFFF